jgi:hypothetical protein
MLILVLKSCRAHNQSKRNGEVFHANRNLSLNSWCNADKGIYLYLKMAGAIPLEGFAIALDNKPLHSSKRAIA